MVKDVNLFHRYLGRYILSFLSLKYILSSLIGDSHGWFPRVIPMCDCDLFLLLQWDKSDNRSNVYML
jgi:hypothetical protein